MKIMPFVPHHLSQFAPHSGHTEMVGVPLLSHAHELAAAGMAYSGVVDGVVIGCAGCAMIWPGRFVAWALLSGATGKHMVVITKAVRRALQTVEGRIETIVSSEFKAGHRWVSMLGFKWHHHEERFLPNGGDADIYVRFQ